MAEGAFDHRTVIGGQGGRVVGAGVGNAEATTEIDVMEGVPLRHQLTGEAGEQPRRMVEGCEIGDLAADMHVDAGDREARQARRVGVDGAGAGQRDAELVLRLARGDLRMRACIDIRIDPDRDRRGQPKTGGDGGEFREFRLALDVEAEDAGLEGGGHFALRLADAREHDALWVDPRREGPAQLTLRDDVHARAEARQGGEDRLIRVRLHGVADEGVVRPEGLGEDPVMPLQRRGGIAVERRADAPGKVRQVDVLGVQAAIAVLEVMHRPACKRRTPTQARLQGYVSCRTRTSTKQAAFPDPKLGIVSPSPVSTAGGRGGTAAAG